MDDLGCPRCKTTKYRVPSLKLMVNACGHALCDSCIELLFVKGTAACPECGVVLRRGGFRIQLFEDVGVEKELDIRRRVLKDFNKREVDFLSLRDYNDYLEDVETIIFNLMNNIDVVGTNRKIEQYKKDNREQIIKGKGRTSEDLLELEAIIEEEKLRSEHLQRQSLALEKEDKLRKIKTREALIDDLMFSDTDAKSIVALHKTDANNARDAAELRIEGMKASVTNLLPTTSSSHFSQDTGGLSLFSTGIQMGTRAQTGFLPVPKAEELPMYQHQHLHLDFSGPIIPETESFVKNNSNYLAFVKPATISERAGGFHSKIALRRALQDAFSDIGFNPGKSKNYIYASTRNEPMDCS